MSQFSRKYYNLDYKRKQSVNQIHTEQKVWEFWRVWGLFEYGVFGILLLILFCICFKEGGVVHAVTQTPKQHQKSQDKTLGEAYPKKVLPSSVLPSGVITIEDYLYFADDTGEHYPNFIDPATHRLIKEKAPQCYKPECPLQEGIDIQSLDAYVKWASEQSHEKLYLVRENGKYRLKKSN